MSLVFHVSKLFHCLNAVVLFVVFFLESRSLTLSSLCMRSRSGFLFLERGKCSVCELVNYSDICMIG